ncbi:hypothetical protein B7463_g11193, partial [Scytalidium lignicola]
MHFFTNAVFTFASLVSFASLGIAQEPASSIIDGFNILTQKSQALIAPSQQLSAFSFSATAQISKGLDDIDDTTIPYTSVLQENTYQGNDAININNAFHNLVQTQVSLMNILTEKSGQINRVPFVGAPIAAGLRTHQGVFDSLASITAQSISGDIKAQIESDAINLMNAIGQATDAYS